MRKVVGFTAGTFDMFHIGHLNLIKNAKARCDYLIVDVNTDALVEMRKRKNLMWCLLEMTGKAQNVRLKQKQCCVKSVV